MAMRFENPLSDAETLIINIDKSIKEIGKKQIIIKIQKVSILVYLSYHQVCYARFSNDKLNIKTLDFTSLFQNLILSGEKIFVEKVRDQWFEIDSKKDLFIAEKNIDF